MLCILHYTYTSHQLTLSIYVQKCVFSLLKVCVVLISSRQTAEESYSDLQSQIEVQQAQHVWTMTTLTAKLGDAKKQHEKMSDKVHGSSVYVCAYVSVCVCV